MASLQLQSARAIVTGGGSGISLAVAKALHAKGVSLLILDLACHREAKDWFESIRHMSGPIAIFRQTDVTSWEELEAAFDFFAQKFGGAPEIVVAGAGVYEASSTGFWDEKDVASRYKLFDINLLHPIKLTRIAIRKLQGARSRGTILHLSSIVAQKPSVVLPLYSVSKAGLSQFVRCMAPLEAVCGIRVVGVAPGVVDTPLFRDHPSAMEHIDMEKDFVLPPDEVVQAMLALLTDRKYPSGTVLEVGDVGCWREVHLLNDPGPKGRSTLPRSKAQAALKLVEDALELDKRNPGRFSKL